MVMPILFIKSDPNVKGGKKYIHKVKSGGGDRMR